MVNSSSLALVIGIMASPKLFKINLFKKVWACKQKSVEKANKNK